MYESQIFLCVCVCIGIVLELKRATEIRQRCGQRYPNTGTGQEFVYILETAYYRQMDHLGACDILMLVAKCKNGKRSQ